MMNLDNAIRLIETVISIAAITKPFVSPYWQARIGALNNIWDILACNVLHARNAKSADEAYSKSDD